MRRLSGLFSALTLVAVAGGCRPTLDGAWDGTVTCPDNTLPVSLLLDEEQDGDLDGVVYIEQVPGILGAEFIVRGDVDDGQYDPDDNEYTFDLQGDDDAPPEFSVELKLNPDDPDDASGDVRQLNDDGSVVQECEIDIKRLSVTDN